MRKIKFEQGKIYHIFNRGVEKRDIFVNDSDRWRFLQGMFLFNDESSSSGLLWHLENKGGGLNFKTLQEALIKHPEQRDPLAKIMADCLMPNHFHLLIQEIKEGGISRFMHKLGTGYTGYFNKKYKRVGGLFQGTFMAVPVENDLHLQYLLVYINALNPGQLIEPNLKEEGVKDLDSVMNYIDNFQWSTHQEYSGKRDSIVIDKGILNEFFKTPEDYKNLVRNVLLDKKTSEINHLILE